MTHSKPSLLWWDLAALLVTTVAVVIGVSEAIAGDPSWAANQSLTIRVACVCAVIAGFLLLYLVLGRRALRRSLAEIRPDRLSVVFTALLLVSLFAAAATVPMFAVLQTLVYPMVWSLSDSYRAAVLWSAGAALSVGLGFGVSIGVQDPAAALVSGSLTASLSFIFATAMGTWITRIAAQGERYRALADELRASQAEVAELSETAGAAAERERLSRELHDTLTQTLAGLVMLSEQAERAFESGEVDRGRERLSRVGAAAREAVAEARALVATTQPLGDGGLTAAIERVSQRLAADTGLRVECELQTVLLERELEVVLLRAAQEGLANARKHARASHVRVALAQRMSGEVELRVVDDGVGPDPVKVERGGFGLSGLSDRVRAVGGDVQFRRAESGGALLIVRVPGGVRTP